MPCAVAAVWRCARLFVVFALARSPIRAPCRIVFVLALVAGVAASPTSAVAQAVADTAAVPRLMGTDTAGVSDDAPAYDEFVGRVAPRGALLRALAIPGWGHASIGSHGRGGFYLGTQAVVGWMLVRTRGRIAAARDLEELRTAAVRARLGVEGPIDEEELFAAVEADEEVADARSLVAARRQQWEDWLAVGIFAVFLSGADAFVSAHLQPFPVDVNLSPVNDQGRTELTVRIPVGPGG